MFGTHRRLRSCPDAFGQVSDHDRAPTRPAIVRGPGGTALTAGHDREQRTGRTVVSTGPAGSNSPGRKGRGGSALEPGEDVAVQLLLVVAVDAVRRAGVGLQRPVLDQVDRL